METKLNTIEVYKFHSDVALDAIQNKDNTLLAYYHLKALQRLRHEGDIAYLDYIREHSLTRPGYNLFKKEE